MPDHLYRRNKIDLSVDLAGIELENPVLLASGTAGYAVELSGVVDLSRLGGVILKSVTLEPCPGNASPRIWETCGGMLNSIGLENIGVEAMIDSVLPGMACSGVTLLASAAGETVRDFARLAGRLEASGGIAGIELNVSCPNVEKGGIQFGSEAGATAAVVTAVRENCSLPVFVKLSAAVADLPRVAEAAAEAGAAGLSLVNTLPGMAIDPVSRRPRLGAVTGGLSGPAIKPVAVKAVWECYRVTHLPIIGGGGICDENDAVEFILAGAAAVSVGTATFQDPRAALRIVEGLPAAVARAGAASVRELTGAVMT